MPEVSEEARITNFLMKKDLVSLLNGIFGFYAIYFFIQGMLETGLVMLLFALLMDTLDGEVARRFFTTTEFGKRMDIADLISFGAAPAIFILVWLSPATIMEEIVLHAAAITLVSAEILRLARFQTRESDGSYFLGIPGTATWILYPVLYLIDPGIYPVAILTFATGLMMVSSFKFPIKPKRLK